MVDSVPAEFQLPSSRYTVSENFPVVHYTRKKTSRPTIRVAARLPVKNSTIRPARKPKKNDFITKPHTPFGDGRELVLSFFRVQGETEGNPIYLAYYVE